MRALVGASLKTVPEARVTRHPRRPGDFVLRCQADGKQKKTKKKKKTNLTIHDFAPRESPPRAVWGGHPAAGARIAHMRVRLLCGLTTTEIERERHVSVAGCFVESHELSKNRNTRDPYFLQLITNTLMELS